MSAAPEDRARLAARLHCDAALSTPGAEIALDAPRAHYLRHVLRLAPGDRVALFNAADGEVAARIAAFAKTGCRVVLGARRRAPAPAQEPDLWLCFAPIKRTRLDTLIEKATELGVSRFVPVFTRHTAMERVNAERLRAIAIEAAEQCERLSVPEIALIQVGSAQSVFTVGADGTAQQVAVRAGARRQGRVEIVEGLSAGTRVVVEGVVKLRNGTPVSEAGASVAGVN